MLHTQESCLPPLFAYVRRRDHEGEECAVCEYGAYEQRTFDTLWCTDCGDSIPRWLTKKEFLEHVADVRGED
jgi:hypothetical protein